MRVWEVTTSMPSDINKLPHLLVCGGRDFIDWKLLEERLDLYTKNLGKLVVVQGDDKGADNLAKAWALKRRHVSKTCYAEWDVHGKAAGPKRNAEMIELVLAAEERFAVAFWDGKSRGTGGCIQLIREVGIPLKIVRYG